MDLSPIPLLLLVVGLAGCEHTAKPAPQPADTGSPPDSGAPDSSPLETAEDTDTGPDTSEAPDLDGDGHDDATDCDDTRADVYPGAPKVCDWVDHDCDGALDCDARDAWALVAPFDQADEGTISYYGDVDGDGVDEIGLRYANIGYGENTAVISVAGLDAGISGERDHLHYQAQMYPLGDVNGDGRADLSVRRWDEYEGDDHSWYIWYSDGLFDSNTLPESDGDSLFEGADRGWPMGLFAGDMNRDGRSEVWIDDVEGDLECRRHLPSTSLATPDWNAADGPGMCFPSDYSSRSFAAVGDVDGDGMSDIAYEGQCAGKFCAGVATAADITATDQAALPLEAGSAASCTGSERPALSAAGDGNQDGLDDIVLLCWPQAGWGSSLVLVEGQTTLGTFGVADGWWGLDATGFGSLRGTPVAGGRVDGVSVLTVTYGETYNELLRDMSGPALRTAFANLPESGVFLPQDANWVTLRNLSAHDVERPPLFGPDLTGDAVGDVLYWDPAKWDGSTMLGNLTVWSGADLIP